MEYIFWFGGIASLFFVFLVLGIYFYHRFRVTTPATVQHSSGYCVVPRFQGPKFFRSSFLLNDQSLEWVKAMAEVGQVYHTHKVKSILCLHGTFVGNDPMGMVGLLKFVYPALSNSLEIKLKKILRGGSSQFLGDTGNFTQGYLELMGKALGFGIGVSQFTWSSENHHAGRLKAALDLCQTLIQNNDYRDSEAILLIGHSHAGQLMALLCLLVDKFWPDSEKLWHLVVRYFPNAITQKDLSILRARRFYFVTLGTSPRYPWPQKRHPYLLNIVNHVGNDLSCPGIANGFFKQSGDYIQKLAGPGSDLRSGLSWQRALNEELAMLLGPGFDLAYWKKCLNLPTRPLNPGYTYLVDFSQQQYKTHQALTSMLGHGVYTRGEHLLNVHELIVQHFFDH